LEFHLRVHGGFQELARANPERILVIDAAAPLADVMEVAWKAVEARVQST
jgi:dTMP kinase